LAFLGQFEYTLDAKNRLTIPPKFRGPLSDGVVLAKDFEPCIAIWPVSGWLQYTQQELGARDRLDPDTRQLRRLVHAGAFEGQLDGAGRIMLPQALIERVGLRKEVTLIGNLDSIEVWDRERWRSLEPELDDQATEMARRLSQRGRR
jgi:MraZ protein